MRTVLFFIIIAFGFMSCNNNEEEVRKDGFTPVLKTQEDSLFHDVMKGHDIGMAKMGRLSKSINLIQQEIDSLDLLKETSSIAERKKNLQEVRNYLQQADEGMYKWMAEFKTDSGENSSQVRIKYLESEKIKVEKVKTDILESLKLADSILQN